MVNIPDYLMLFDQLTDYANKYGDMELLELFYDWQQKKLGKSPEKGENDE